MGVILQTRGATARRPTFRRTPQGQHWAAVAEQNYAALLRKAMEAKGMSRRKLSFAMAARTKNKQPSDFRALGKYLNGTESPSPKNAAILAVELEEPELALVSPQRRVRLAELAATVGDHQTAIDALTERLEDLEGRVPRTRRRAAGGR